MSVVDLMNLELVIHLGGFYSLDYAVTFVDGTLDFVILPLSAFA